MRIDFESSGGYVPVPIAFTADTDELPFELAQELTRLVEDSGVFDFQEERPGSPGFPDAVSYAVSIFDGARSKSVSVNDVTAGRLLPLVTRLRKLALDARNARDRA